MKKIITTAIIASIMTLAVVPAMAAPHHGQPQHHQKHDNKRPHQMRQHQKQPPKHMQAPKHHVQNSKYQQVKPSRDWRRGQVVKSNYRTKTHWVDSRQQKHLPKAGKNERWLKVNQDYVLINSLSNVIIHMIAGR